MPLFNFRFYLQTSTHLTAPPCTFLFGGDYTFRRTPDQPGLLPGKLRTPSDHGKSLSEPRNLSKLQHGLNWLGNPWEAVQRPARRQATALSASPHVRAADKEEEQRSLTSEGCSQGEKQKHPVALHWRIKDFALTTDIKYLNVLEGFYLHICIV